MLRVIEKNAAFGSAPPFSELLRGLCAFVLAMMICAPAVSASPVAVAAQGPVAASIEHSSNPELDYKMGPGDKIRLITFGEDSLTGEFLVSPAGVIALPLVGDLQAAGLSTSEFQARVQKALSEGYLKDPKVSIEVINYRPFYILGEVTKPGEYHYVSGLTVQNAVAMANGYTYRADTKHLKVKHMNSEVEDDVKMTQSLKVLPGDTIRILERLF